MRVTAGKYKNKQVKTVKSNDVRPTLSKIRESMFNIIQTRVDGASMLDLFAGSGIMGIEAASRGADSVIYIEKNPRTAKILKDSLRGFDFNYKVFIGDAIKSMDKLKGQKFDVIFADPPYFEGLFPDVLAKVKNNELLAQDGILIVECDSSYQIEDETTKSGLVLSKLKTYGNTTLAFIEE